MTLHVKQLCLVYIWEDEQDIEDFNDPFLSLDDNSICGDSIGIYVVKFASIACNIFGRGRSKSPLYVPALFKLQASSHDMLWLP
jgi:hypothetical protein